MSKITLTGFALPLVLFFANTSGICAAQPRQSISDASTGTLEKTIVENGSVTLNLDLNGLNGSNALVTRPVTLQFAAATNSFFPILVFNDLLRGPEPGSLALVVQSRAVPVLPTVLAAALNQLVLEKLPDNATSDLREFCPPRGRARRQRRVRRLSNTGILPVRRAGIFVCKDRQAGKPARRVRQDA